MHALLWVLLLAHVAGAIGKVESDTHISLDEYPDPINAALYKADLHTVQALIKRMDDPIIVSGDLPLIVDRKDIYGRTQLFNCGGELSAMSKVEIDMNCKVILKLLAKKGANVSHIDQYGDTPLSFAVSRGYYLFSEALLSLGSPVNVMDQLGRSPLMKAAGYGFLDVFHLLYKKGADTSARDENGLTALHYVTRLAIENKTYVHNLVNISSTAYLQQVDLIRDSHGRTALMYAVLNKCESCVSALLQAGADAQLVDDFNVSVVEMTEDQRVLEVLQESAIRKIEKEHLNWLKKVKPEEL